MWHASYSVQLLKELCILDRQADMVLTHGALQYLQQLCACGAVRDLFLDSVQARLAPQGIQTCSESTAAFNAAPGLPRLAWCCTPRSSLQCWAMHCLQVSLHTPAVYPNSSACWWPLNQQHLFWSKPLNRVSLTCRQGPAASVPEPCPASASSRQHHQSPSEIPVAGVRHVCPGEAATRSLPQCLLQSNR